ncbi:MAG: hypothetical protein EKK53_11165 [Burkholderiales bacterium]|nr:MAG: hypothetical protein EKK53_11165 [Burkholderiales bacterium]
MNPPSTLAFVLRFYGFSFVGGLAVLALSIVGLVNFTPDPPELPYESLVSMLGIWPYVIAMPLGSFMAARAWLRGSALRNGRG